MPNEVHSGVVSSIRIANNPLENTYNVVAEKISQIKSDRQLELYEHVEISEGKIKNSLGIAAKNVYETAIAEKIKDTGTARNAKGIVFSGKAYEAVAKRLMPELERAARLLVKGFLSGAPIVVRFHNDGDGSSGAIALHRALSKLQKDNFTNERNVSWQMNKSIAYTTESFYADKMLFDSYKSIEKPIIVITDFGTAPESVDAMRLASGNCEMIWLDHHMPYEGFPRELAGNYINVFDFGGDSNFSAGLLTCIFAQIISDVDVDDLKGAALISDYSTYADFNDGKALKNSVILDFLTSTGKDAYGKPKQMDIILTNPERSEKLFGHAKSLLDESILVGTKNIKSYKNSNNTSIYVLDFGHVAKLRYDYPLPGRYSSKLQDRLESENGGNTITIVHYGNYISVRISKDISESVNLLKIIEKLKTVTGNAVSGGGHRQAASVRADKEDSKEVLRLLLQELGIAV